MVAFVLVFIHIGSRRVFLSPATYNPDNPWLEQQVRNVHVWCQDEGIEPKYLIHDNDGIFRGTFDGHMERMGVETKKTSIRAPNMNAYAESWIASLQRECLDFFVCVSLRQLDRICSCYANFHKNWSYCHTSLCCYFEKGSVSIAVLSTPTFVVGTPIQQPRHHFRRQIGTAENIRTDRKRALCRDFSAFVRAFQRQGGNTHYSGRLRQSQPAFGLFPLGGKHGYMVMAA